jgi:hypothetical protein
MHVGSALEADLATLVVPGNKILIAMMCSPSMD